MTHKTAHFGGSRALPEQFSPFVAQVVGAWLRSSPAARVAVGCARGADEFALRACSASPSRLAVFAAFSSSGAGSWSGSSVPAVALAARSGASVSWLAGGSLSVPLFARLLRRSLAALAVSSVACFFLASPSSSGSLRVAAAAARSGLPVFAFACGFSGSPAPLAGLAGAWVPGSFCGFPCWSWSPASRQPSLF